MSTDNYLTASCVIKNQVVYRNGLPVFTGDRTILADFLTAAYRFTDPGYPKFYKMDNLSKLGFIASEILLKPRAVNTSYNPEEIGVVLANANSSLDTDVKYYETVSNIASPSLFVYTLPNIMIGEICIRNGFKGENAFFVFNSFDANFTRQYVSNLLDTNILKACICGWVEVLQDDYHAVLFLVEKKDGGEEDLLTIENINKIYELDHG